MQTASVRSYLTPYSSISAALSPSPLPCLALVSRICHGCRQASRRWFTPLPSLFFSGTRSTVSSTPSCNIPSTRQISGGVQGLWLPLCQPRPILLPALQTKVLLLPPPARISRVRSPG